VYNDRVAKPLLPAPSGFSIPATVRLAYHA
jgi:hypothetical protein